MDAFLAFSHLGRTFTLTNVSPSSFAPGKGSVVFNEFNLTIQSQNWDEEVTITSEIHGEKIANIYVEAFLKVEDQLFGPVYCEYLISPHTNVVKGVAYPQWESDVSVSQLFKLSLPVLTNGEQSAFGFATPENYCTIESEKAYRVIGNYQFGEGGSITKARARFDVQGNLNSMISLVERKGGKSFPKKITSKGGDSFCPLVRQHQLLETTFLEAEDGYVLADTLDNPGLLKRIELPPLVGSYFVDILVQDLDGNSYRHGSVVEIK